MYQPLDQQNVLSANIGFMAEKDLHHLGGLASLLPAVLRLDELADHRNFQSAHQVSHEHKRIFKNSERLNGLPLIVVRDMPRQLLDTFLYVLRRYHRAKRLGCCTHKIPCLPALNLCARANQFRLSHPVPLSSGESPEIVTPSSLHQPVFLGSKPPRPPASNGIAPELESPASKRSRLRSRRPARVCALAAKRAAPAATL